MAAKTTTRSELPSKNKADTDEKPMEGLILDADYAEDRSVALLAERQREFQKTLRYIDTEMPAI